MLSPKSRRAESLVLSLPSSALANHFDRITGDKIQAIRTTLGHVQSRRSKSDLGLGASKLVLMHRLYTHYSL
jgi:hypothetical protein